MAGTTSVPPIEFTTAGLILPTDAAILAGVQADWNAAFGGNLNPQLSSPQGQKATTDAAIISDKNAKFAYFVNQIDPATSSGFMQDAIGRLYFLERIPARSTTVDVVCTGGTGVVIPIGSLVQDGNGNLFSSTAAATIPAGGSVTIPFAAVNTGPLPCPPNSINTIYRTINGWDSAVNLVDGVIGADVENRADFEYRRQNSVAANANGVTQAIYGNVINVTGVTDAYVIDNRLDTSVVIDGVTLLPHSIYAAVVGGADLAVATAIYKKISGGANMNGNTTVTVTDDTPGYATPAPTEDITFQRPPDQQIYFAITCQNISGVDNATVRTAIQNAVVAAFGGAYDGTPRARIHSTIIALNYVAPIFAAAQVAILSVFVGGAAAPTTPSYYVNINSNPVIAPANVGVTFV